MCVCVAGVTRGLQEKARKTPSEQVSGHLPERKVKQAALGDPSQLVHKIIEVYWAHGDSGWYDAVVLEYVPDTGKHRVAYVDGDGETLDFAKAEKPWIQRDAGTQLVMDAFELVLREGDTQANEYAQQYIEQLRSSRSTKGFSALHLAVSKGHAETVATLLRAGLDPDSPCGRMSLTARSEADSQKSRGKTRMEIYRLIQLHRSCEQPGSSAVAGTPSGPGMDMTSPALDTSVDTSMDTSLHEPTPNAVLQQLVKDQGDSGRDFCAMMEKKISMRPPAMPAAKGAKRCTSECKSRV